MNHKIILALAIALLFVCDYVGIAAIFHNLAIIQYSASDNEKISSIIMIAVALVTILWANCGLLFLHKKLISTQKIA